MSRSMQRREIRRKVRSFNLPNCQRVYLEQIAIRRYNMRTQGKKESMEQTATIVMRKMPELCSKVKGLEHKKNFVLTSYDKSFRELERRLESSPTVDENLLRGPIIENVIEYIISSK